jgi:hypothetical protein
MPREIPFILSCLIAAACGVPDGADATEEADSAVPPSAFTAQFIGRYQGSLPLASLDLRRDGTFTQVTSSGIGTGRFRAAPGRRTLPLEIRLRSRGHEWKALVRAYDATLHVIREGSEQTLRLVRPQASDEELCDSTGGRWTDDDPDPATGLYCVCPAGRRFIPSSGGCVP